MLALLPVVFLRDIQIRPKLKIGICCILGLGVLWDPLWPYTSQKFTNVRVELLHALL